MLARLANRIIYSAIYFFGVFVYRPTRIKCGDNFKISPFASIKHPRHIAIGDNVFVNHNCCLWAGANSRILIGSDVLLGPGVTIISSNHGFQRGVLIRLQEETEHDVSIGNDCWIGANSVILPGVILGDGCVVGAGSVVTKDMPPFSICAGVPAKIIKKRI